MSRADEDEDNDVATDMPERVEDKALARVVKHTAEPEVHHPSHYNQNGFEVVDIADAFNLCRYAFNVIKYVLRAKFKGNELQDLKKARFYLDRLIHNKEKEV